MTSPPPCDLCASTAAVRCDADDAFLCFPCDAKVHAANFLVARHVRRAACAACRSFDPEAAVPFSGSAPRSLCCRSCAPNRAPSSSSSSSSSSSKSCVSTAESAGRRRLDVDGRVRRVLEVWSARIGLKNRERCAVAAAEVLGRCQVRALPLRVALAAALWVSAKNYGESGRAVLARLESCSGVPARVIAAAEARVGPKRIMLEDWAESQ